jgi:small conductance mechanosensitive channel
MLESLMSHLDPSAVAQTVAEWLPRAAAALALLVFFVLLASGVRRGVHAGLGRTHMPEGTRTLMARFARYVVVILGTLTILDQLGVNVTSMIAGLGIAGLAISFAAQDTIANIISGVTLMLDQPFKQGDWIALGDTHATVTEVRLRTTVLTTFDNETIVIPNQSLASERIINYTLTPRARVRVNVGIAYKDNIDAARTVMLGLLEGDERILPDPAPVVVVTGLGASSVDLQMRFWTENPGDKFPLTAEYTEKAKNALDAANIEIPFPHLQLFVEDSDGVRRLAGGGTNA